MFDQYFRLGTSRFPLQQGSIGEKFTFNPSVRLPMIVFYLIHASEVVG